MTGIQWFNKNIYDLAKSLIFRMPTGEYVTHIISAPYDNYSEIYEAVINWLETDG